MGSRFKEDDVQRAIEKTSRLFGLENGFRSEQKTALSSFLRGHDMFVSLPTGFGKSLIFQAAPICMDYLLGLGDNGNEDGGKSLVIVVMPLKSLVSDQLSRANDLHISAADLTGGLTDPIREGIHSASYSILFASPEVLLDDDGRELFNMDAVKRQLCGLFIDESHCVSKWGSSSGDTKAFRSAYGKLGEVRSKLRSSVPVVAMTATATKDVRRSVVGSLGLRNYVQICRSPERLNIKHVFVRSKTKDFDRMLGWMVDEIKEDGEKTDRTIIYCQSRKVVSTIYAMFMDLLPRSACRYVQMYHTNTESTVQEHIIRCLSNPTGEVRVLVATIAYGMGVDLKAVHRTIICGRPSDLDDYMQMSGRIGRDGKPSVAVTLQYPGDTAGRCMTETMKEFVEGKDCRRETIRRVFGKDGAETALTKHSCCDVCSLSCTCEGTSCSAAESSLEKFLRKAVDSKERVDELPIKIATPSQVTRLERALDDYRRSLLQQEEGHIYCGADIACGFSEGVASQIVRDCNVHFSFHAFISRYNFPSRKIGLDTWEILCSSLDRVGLEDDSECSSMEEDDSEASYSESEFQEAQCSDIE